MVTSPSIGTIRVSCDSSHQIIVTTLCDVCSKFTKAINGYSPLTVIGLDPGMRYTVIINVFGRNRQGLNVQKTITVISTTPNVISTTPSVISTTPSKINDHMYMQTVVYM